ncbi:hypothetical protein FXE63_05395 [Vibrio mimicus]|nr:hypothetical protein FXE63_05395 [Vibrio mimicus]
MPENGASVPCWRQTKYCSSVKCSRQYSSGFSSFSGSNFTVFTSFSLSFCQAIFEKNLPYLEFVAHTFSLYFEQDFLMCSGLKFRHILRQLVSIKSRLKFKS